MGFGGFAIIDPPPFVVPPTGPLGCHPDAIEVFSFCTANNGRNACLQCCQRDSERVNAACTLEGGCSPAGCAAAAAGWRNNCVATVCRSVGQGDRQVPVGPREEQESDQDEPEIQFDSGPYGAPPPPPPFPPHSGPIIAALALVDRIRELAELLPHPPPGPRGPGQPPPPPGPPQGGSSHIWSPTDVIGAGIATSGLPNLRFGFGAGHRGAVTGVDEFVFTGF